MKKHRYNCTMRLVGCLLLVSSCVSNKPFNTIKKTETYESNDIFHISELAEVAYYESRWTDATRHYQKLTESIPDDAYIWFRLANTYAQKGDLHHAIHAYKTSIKKEPLLPKPWFNLSTTYLLSAKEALQQSWEQLRENDPARALILERVKLLDDLLNHNMDNIKIDE